MQGCTVEVTEGVNSSSRSSGLVGVNGATNSLDPYNNPHVTPTSACGHSPAPHLALADTDA